MIREKSRYLENQGTDAEVNGKIVKIIWATIWEKVPSDKFLTFWDFKFFREDNLSKVEYFLFD